MASDFTRNLKEIFYAIQPDSVRNNPFMVDSMDIFIELLEELSPESIDISSRFVNKRIKEELIKTYLFDLYSVIGALKTNQKLISAIERKNKLFAVSGNEGYEYISLNISEDIVDEIKDEHFYAFRSYREKKGTVSAMEFIYGLIGSLVKHEQNSGVVIIEGVEPFDLDVQGALPAEFYYYLVSPLALPFGFTETYSQIVFLDLEDYWFPTDYEYTINVLEVLCLIPDPDNPNRVIEVRTDFSDRVLDDVYERHDNYPLLTRYFFGGEHSGEYLEFREELSGKILIRVFKKENDEIILIKEFSDDCILNHDISKFDRNENDKITWEDHSWLEDQYPVIDDDGEFDISPEYADNNMPYFDWVCGPSFERVYSESRDEEILGNCKCLSVIGQPDLYINRTIHRFYDEDRYYATVNKDKIARDYGIATIIGYDEGVPIYEYSLPSDDRGEYAVMNNLELNSKEYGTIGGDAYYVSHRSDDGLRINDEGFYVLSKNVIARDLTARYINELDLWINDEGFYVLSEDLSITGLSARFISGNEDYRYYECAFHQHSDCKFEFGVYRDGTLLSDHNMSAL